MKSTELRSELLSDARLQGHPLWVAYIMATVQHETGGTYQPIAERYGRVCRYCYAKHGPLSIKAACKVRPKTVHEFVYDKAMYFTAMYELNENVRAQLGNLAGDGPKFYGRGYVQITGRRNYTIFGQLLNIPLVENPDLAMEHEYAYDILVRGMVLGLFTGKKLSDYVRNESADYLNSRKIINGLDQAKKIAQYAQLHEMEIGPLVS